MKAKQFLWIDLAGFCNGMVLYAPVAILVRLNKGVSLSWFFYLQAILSFLIFLLTSLSLSIRLCSIYFAKLIIKTP